jgi:hypothetical protein
MSEASDDDYRDDEEEAVEDEYGDDEFDDDIENPPAAVEQAPKKPRSPAKKVAQKNPTPPRDEDEYGDDEFDDDNEKPPAVAKQPPKKPPAKKVAQKKIVPKTAPHNGKRTKAARKSMPEHLIRPTFIVKAQARQRQQVLIKKKKKTRRREQVAPITPVNLLNNAQDVADQRILNGVDTPNSPACRLDTWAASVLPPSHSGNNALRRHKASKAARILEKNWGKSIEFNDRQTAGIPDYNAIYDRHCKVVASRHFQHTVRRNFDKPLEPQCAFVLEKRIALAEQMSAERHERSKTTAQPRPPASAASSRGAPRMPRRGRGWTEQRGGGQQARRPHSCPHSCPGGQSPRSQQSAWNAAASTAEQDTRKAGAFDWAQSTLYTKEAKSSPQQYQESQQERLRQFYSNLHNHELVSQESSSGGSSPGKEGGANNHAPLSSAFEDARWKLEVLWSELWYPRRQRETFSEGHFQQLTPQGYSLVVGQITSLAIIRSRLIQILRLVSTHSKYLAVVSQSAQWAVEPTQQQQHLPEESRAALRKLTQRLKEQITSWLQAAKWVPRFVFNGRDYLALCEHLLTEGAAASS